MLKCWNGNSEDRPTFERLRSLLDDIEAKEGNYVNFTNLSTIKTLPPMKQIHAEAQSTTESNSKHWHLFVVIAPLVSEKTSIWPLLDLFNKQLNI